jgi:hypothetical protein
MRIRIQLLKNADPCESESATLVWYLKLSIHIKLSVHINWRELNFGLKNFNTPSIGNETTQCWEEGDGTVRKKRADWDFRNKND